MYIIHDSTGTYCASGKYCAFGLTSYNASFCCNKDPKDINAVTLRGAGYDDLLSFRYTDGTTEEVLTNALAEVIVAYQHGRAGADEMHGSPSTSSDYDEVLQGDGDDDDIQGHDGGEVIEGWGGSDTCDGGDGVDEVRGGADDDVVLGGAHNDIVAGSIGEDDLNGGVGADILFGEAGADLYCGGNDSAYDQLIECGTCQDEDVMWGAGTGDDESPGADLNAPGDGCSENGTYGDCEYELLTAPTCP